jgi:hypothetical protein
VAELDVLMVRLDQFDKRMDERFQALNTRLDDMNHAVTARLESLDTRLLALEGRLTVIDERLDHKAGNWVVSLRGATVAMLIGAATALVKLWP